MAAPPPPGLAGVPAHTAAYITALVDDYDLSHLDLSYTWTLLSDVYGWGRLHAAASAWWHRRDAVTAAAMFLPDGGQALVKRLRNVEDQPPSNWTYMGRPPNQYHAVTGPWYKPAAPH